MKREVIGRMKCPYCLGRFGVAHEVGDEDSIQWGLLRCRCFEFPIVDGVLLLGLVKSYGGSEEVLAPYVPLQVAAVNHLQADDVPGLRRWIARHVPLLHRLIEPDRLDYLGFSRDLNARLWPQVEKDLFSWNRYEVLGRRAAVHHGGSSVNALAATQIGSLLMRTRRRLFPQVWSTFYVGRFISNELAELRTRLQEFRFAGPVLSLCCGHGPFELLLRARFPDVPIVSMDGQLLNLFIVKRFIAPDSTYICHDLQFPLPFDDGVFGEVFSSTCLSELPSQANFIREAVRVTSDAGWTMFDGVTPDPASRIAPTRFYRVCQNHFEAMEDYRLLMAECAKGRTLHFTPLKPAKPRWTNDPAMLTGVPSATFIFNGLRSKGDEHVGGDEFSVGEKALLAVNPRYQVRIEADRLVGRLRFGERVATKLKSQILANLPHEIVIDRSQCAQPRYLEKLYESGTIVMLPKDFAGDVVKVF